MPSLTRVVENLLRLERGDLRRGLLLFSFLFLVMWSYLVSRVVRDALYLDQYDPSRLPFADLAIAVLTGFVVSLYLLIGKKTTLRNLLAGAQVFFALNCLAFWWLSLADANAPWLYPVIYIWVGLMGVLAPAQVWTLANFVMTAREAKRIFAFVQSGAISGAVVGGLFSGYAAKQFGTPNLLLAIAAAFALCALLVVRIWGERAALLPTDEFEGVGATEAPPPLFESLRRIWSAPYLRVLAGLILVASLVTSLAGWQFKALAKMFIPDRDLLASFFGQFYFWAGLAGLLVQRLVTGRLLRRFGIGPALFVVPVALFFAGGGVLLWGAATIWAAIALRSSINVLQYSIDKPSVELLYLPVPAPIKNDVKTFIDTVIWRAGDGSYAVLVMLFVAAPLVGLDAIQVSWLTMTLALAWMAVAYAARRRYVATLRESIRHYRLDAERAMAPVIDHTTADVLAASLQAADPKEILYALSLFEAEHHAAAHPAVRGLLEHPSAEVRARAMEILTEAGDTTVVAKAEQLLSDPDLAVRTAALVYLMRHAHVDPLARIEQLGDFPDYSIRSAMVAFLARPGETQNLVAARALLGTMLRETGPEGRRTRREAARLLGMLPPEFDEELRTLLLDADLEVRREAIRSVGQLRRRRWVLRVIEALGVPELAPDAAEALARFNDTVVGTLRDHLADPETPIEIRREIPGVLARIGTAAATRALQHLLFEADTALRYRIIVALNRLARLHPEIALDRQMVETVLAAEILGHYRSYQILGTLGPDVAAGEPVARALRQSMDEDIERIFRLLTLLYPAADFHSAHVGLQSANPVIHDNAIEFLDNVLPPGLRNMLVPLLDSAVTPAARVELANRMIGLKIQSREEAVAALLASEDAWLKSCGAYAVGALGLRSLQGELDRCLEHPDPLLRETARQAKLRLATASASD